VTEPAPTAAQLRAEQLLTVEEVAERWRVEKSQIHRLVRTDRLPCVRTGRYVRFLPAQIVDFEQAGGSE
jgi:excisionase family DNA binding protein